MAPAVMKLARAALRDCLGAATTPVTVRVHLDAAMQWLCRAQDAAGGGGVARSYSLRWQRAHGRRGWLAAYPETTGYIIPTFCDYAALTGQGEFTERALRMAAWETEVQMESGAVQGGVIGFPPTPAIFNTGQVLFGWARAFRATGETRFAESVSRGCDFLVAAQDDDGAWRRHGSRYARPGVNVYDARTAWGLAVGAEITGERRHRAAAMRNLDFALTRQQSNGWFADCCLDDDARPLLHTLAYTMEGLLGAGMLLGEERYVAAARRTALALLRLQRPDGSLAGRFDRSWRAAGRWSCLTGDAQTALVWLQLSALDDDDRLDEAGRRMNRFLMRTQELDARDPGVRGGIKGSQPIWAEYGPYEYPNWAAKFFADALICECRRDKDGGRPV